MSEPDPSPPRATNAPTPGAAERQPGYAWVVMAMLWGMDLANVMIFASVGVLLPVWEEDLGVTPLQAGLLGAAGFMGFGLMALPASIWLTMYNPRLVTLVCALAMAGVGVAQAVAPNVHLLIAFRFTFVLLAVSRIQMQVIFIQQWFQPRLYATVNSLDFSNRSIGQTIGIAAIPALAVLLGSWRIVYASIALALLFVAVLWAFLGRERRRSYGEWGPPTQVGNPAGVLRRHKVLWVLAGCQIGAAMAFGSMLTFFPTYAIEHLDISITSAGFLMGVFSVGAILGSLSSGPISQAIGRRKPFIWIPGLLLPLAYFAVLRVDVMPLVVLLLLLAGACAMAVPPMLTTIPLDMGLAPREVAVAVGLTRTFFPLSAALGPLLVGLLQESTGSLLLGLSIVAPLPITLFIGGYILPETGPAGNTRRREPGQTM
ncbi:MAG: MFS transporter [Chloroflexi bacterium]|nr:MFS transporter [Chloroflexota bacterium]